MEQDVLERRLPRRAVLERLVGAAGVAMVSGMLAACGAPAASPTAAPQAAQGTAPAPGQTAVRAQLAPTAAAPAGTSAAPATNATAATPAPAAATAVPATAPAAAAGKGVTLNFYYPVGVSGPLAKIVDGMAQQFTQENPGIKVTPIFSGSYLDTIAKVQQQIQAGSPPDAAILNAAAIYTMTDGDSVLPLDDLIKSSGGAAYIQDFFPAFLMNSQLGGKTWSIPFQRSTLITYYNKDMFKAAGLDPEKPPATWAELVDAGKKLTKKDSGVWGVGFPSDGSTYWEFQALAIEAGQNVFKNDAGNVVYFNSDASLRGLQFLIDLSKTNGVMQGGTIAWATLPTDFASGKVGMIYHSTGSLTSVLSAAKFQVGTAFCPADKQPGTPTGGGNLYLFKASPKGNQDAAWKFVQWMTTPEREVQWTKDTGYVAPRKSAWDTPAMKDYVAKTPQVTVARDQLQYAQNELGTHNMAEVQTILSNALQAAITGQQQPKAALDSAQQQAEAILSAYKN